VVIVELFLLKRGTPGEPPAVGLVAAGAPDDFTGAGPSGLLKALMARGRSPC